MSPNNRKDLEIYTPVPMMAKRKFSPKGFLSKHWHRLLIVTKEHLVRLIFIPKIKHLTFNFCDVKRTKTFINSF